MAAAAPTPEVARPGARTGWDVAEACLGAAAFAVLCVLVLRAVPYLPEPDDYAYRASIGSQLAVVPGPGGTVELKPGPGVMTGGPGKVAPAGPGRAVRIGPSSKRSAWTP